MRTPWKGPPLWLALLVALALRLVHVGGPILGVHSWRQSDTAAIARNFHEHGYDFTRPQVDWGGATSGVVECELPIYPYAVALLYGVFGPHEAWARLLSILFSLLGILFAHHLTRDHVDAPTGRWTALLLAVLPLHALFGRAVMPEPLLLCASSGGLWAFSRWTRTGRRSDYGLAAAGVGLAIALKPQTVVLAAPLLFLAWLRFGPRSLANPRLWGFAALALAPAALWYPHARSLFHESGLSFGIWDGGKWANWELVTSGAYWERILVVRIAHRHLTWPGVALLAVGACLRRRRPEEWLFEAWLAGLLVSLVVVGVGHYEHSYYQLPLVAPLAVLMAKAPARFLRGSLLGDWRTAATAALLVALAGASASGLREHYDREDPAASPELRMAEALRAASAPHELVVSTRADPTLLHLAARRGWRADAAELDAARLEELVDEGAALLVAVPGGGGWDAAQARNLERAARSYTVVHRDGDAWLIRLAPP